jgi:hypothetical protein
VAHIFLSYVGSAARVRPLRESLARQRHQIYSLAEFDYRISAALQKLAEFDVIIAVWSGGAERDESFLAIATEASRLQRLISVRAPGFSADALPEPFHQLSLLPVSDANGLAACIAAVPPASGQKHLPPIRPERTEGIGSSGSAPYRIDAIQPPVVAERTVSQRPSQTASNQNAVEAEAGRLAHKIPDRMWVGEPELVEVRLGREDASGLITGISGRGSLTTADIPIVETMSIALISSPGAFDIERQSETTQLVMNDVIAGSAFGKEEFGCWTWLVTPKKAGAHQLILKVSAGLKDSRGVPTSARLPDREFKVAVSVNARKATTRFLRRSAIALGGAIGAALLGKITQELWWPKIKALLQAWGMIG